MIVVIWRYRERIAWREYTDRAEADAWRRLLEVRGVQVRLFEFD